MSDQDGDGFARVKEAFAELGIEANLRVEEPKPALVLSGAPSRARARLADAIAARGIAVEVIDEARGIRGTVLGDLGTLDVLEDRSVSELVDAGDADGREVIVIKTGKRGKIRCGIVRDAHDRIVGHTRLTFEDADGRGGALPFAPDELAAVNEVRVTSTGELGIAWCVGDEWFYLADGREVGREIKLSRELLEPATVVRAISSIRVDHSSPAHDRIHVWNRGAHAGALVVQRGDGTAIASALCEVAMRRMCSGRIAAIRSLRSLAEELRAAVVRLGDFAELDELARQKERMDLIVTLGDAAIAADVAANNVEKEIPK